MQNFKLFYVSCFFLISSLAFKFSLSPEYPTIKICRSRNRDCKMRLDPYKQVRYYLRQYSQCTHIIGNLVLCNLRRTSNGSDPDLSFLQSIQEVSGYVYISNNDVRRIPLTSLRIIRGRFPYEIENVGKCALVISRNSYNKTIGLEEIDFRSLTVIQEHNVALWDNPCLCYLVYKVDFRRLFTDDRKQSVVRVPDEDVVSQFGCDYDEVNCHPACAHSQYPSHCWGPRSDQCQLNPKCTDDEGRYCQMNVSNAKIRCDDACIGGCVHNPSHCWACRVKQNGDTCAGSCPPKYVVGHISSRQEPNPDFKYDLHDICVKSCPVPFLKMDTICVIECDFKTTIPSNGTCEPCEASSCARHCTKEQIFGKNFALMTGKAANKMKTCEYYSGPIYINKESFKILPTGVPRTKIDDLWHLRNLKEVVGYIYIDLTGAPVELTNTSFLENLYKLTAEFNDEVSLGIALSLYGAEKLEFLGFKSLRYVDTDAFLEDIPSLCYLSALEKVLPMRTKRVKSPESCLKEGHVCHSECLPVTGCWGPGPAMCANCCGFRAGSVCVTKCTDEPGFYTPPDLNHHNLPIRFNSRISAEDRFQCSNLPLTAAQIAQTHLEIVMAAIKPASECARCDPECAETCMGPENTDCIGPCKNFKENSSCVPTCSRAFFPDTVMMECGRCDPVCTKAVTSSLLPPTVNACSGPGRQLGRGGCTFCHFISKDIETSTYACLEKGCPPGHFGKIVSLTDLNLPLEQLSPDNLNADALEIKTCLPCHPLCASCTGSGTHLSVCLECKMWTYKSECVEVCPADDSYVPNKNSSTSTLSVVELEALAERQCLLCHRQCTGGCYAAGPDKCVNCRFRKIVLDESSGNFVCNSTCPPDAPYVMPNTNLCLDKSTFEFLSGNSATRARNRILLGTGLGLLALLLLVTILVIPLFYYRSKRDKIREALRSTYMNITAPDMKSQAASREPNMGRLVIINMDDLSFDASAPPLGTGAFGAVYKGKWRVPKSLYNEYIGLHSAFLDVAIKVIRTPTAKPPKWNNYDDQKTTPLLDENYADLKRVTEKNHLDEMLSEAKVMASVSHVNCLPLIGICLTRQCMVSAFIDFGSMDRYLRKNQHYLNSYTLLSWAEQIADGMAYLEARGIIHRDLAARNVLVQSLETVKITDFGLAKMLENLDEDSIVVQVGRVPIRWLAIETLQHGIYSHKTDVWSYGVTLWEIFTYGKQPYENLETVDIKDHVMKGGRLNQPDICTLDAYMVMVKCWMEDFESRPTFLELMRLFHTYCKTPKRYLYIQGDDYSVDYLTPTPRTPGVFSDDHEMNTVHGIRGVPDGNIGHNGSVFNFSEGSVNNFNMNSGGFSNHMAEGNETDALLSLRYNDGRNSRGLPYSAIERRFHGNNNASRLSGADRPYRGQLSSESDFTRNFNSPTGEKRNLLNSRFSQAGYTPRAVASPPAFGWVRPSPQSAHPSRLSVASPSLRDNGLAQTYKPSTNKIPETELVEDYLEPKCPEDEDLNYQSPLPPLDERHCVGEDSNQSEDDWPFSESSVTNPGYVGTKVDDNSSFQQDKSSRHVHS